MLILYKIDSHINGNERLYLVVQIRGSIVVLNMCAPLKVILA